MVRRTQGANMTHLFPLRRNTSPMKSAGDLFSTALGSRPKDLPLPMNDYPAYLCQSRIAPHNTTRMADDPSATLESHDNPL
jgi:hypothetical protein